MKEVSVTPVKVDSHLTSATFLEPATTWQKHSGILEFFFMFCTSIEMDTLLQLDVGKGTKSATKHNIFLNLCRSISVWLLIYKPIIITFCRQYVFIITIKHDKCSFYKTKCYWRRGQIRPYAILEVPRRQHCGKKIKAVWLESNTLRLLCSYLSSCMLCTFLLTRNKVFPFREGMRKA